MAETLRSALSQVRDVLSLAHLITESNIKAFATPIILSGLLAVASGGVTVDSPSWLQLAAAFPKVALYSWLYVLYFDCSNQKDPGSVEEDRINKPWRAIPSGRLSIEGAQQWYYFSCCILPLVAGLWLGGFPEAIAFMVETWAYDSLGGGHTWWGRAIINPLFFSTGQLGAIRVAAGTSTAINRQGLEWCMLHGMMVFSTIPYQDLRDVEGDNARGRKTLPVVLGDGPTRVVLMVSVAFWSLFMPYYWRCSVLGYVLPVLVGAFVSTKFLLERNVKADRKNFHMYSLLWMPAIYATPMFSQAVAGSL